MIVRVGSYLAGWARPSLIFALVGLVVLSCTESEDTEPFVPAVDGATQPEASGDLISEADACDRLLAAAQDAYDQLRCDEPMFLDCPQFLRPGAGSGCYTYREGSIEACEEAYENAASCRTLSPCLATAELDTSLEGCDVPDTGSGGAGGGNEGGSANLGGAGDTGGAPAAGGQMAQGGNDSVAGQPAGGSN
jgi:hypothetical protein